MSAKRPQSPKSETMANELFSAVERAQGYAYLSDGIFVLSPADMVILAKSSRKWHRLCDQQIKVWLRKWEPKLKQRSV